MCIERRNKKIKYFCKARYQGTVQDGTQGSFCTIVLKTSFTSRNSIRSKNEGSQQNLKETMNIL